MFYIALVKPENRPKLRHLPSYAPTSRNNIDLPSSLIYFVAAWNTGFIKDIPLPQWDTPEELIMTVITLAFNSQKQIR